MLYHILEFLKSLTLLLPHVVELNVIHYIGNIEGVSGTASLTT